MPWGPMENDLFRKKYEILQQQANNDTTRANAAAQDVGQRGALQQQTDQAAMDRAQVAARNQELVAGMNNQNAMDVAGLNARNRVDVANVGESGANYRTGLTTGTQKSIADQSLGLEREKLAQQESQFGQTFGLDTAKAQEAAIQSRATLGMPEYGTPTYNYNKKQIETMIKRPAITNLAPSPLSTLGGQNGIGMESDDTLRKIRSQLAQ